MSNRQCFLDIEAKLGVSRPQRVLDLPRRFRFGKNKPQIRSTFGPCQDGVADSRRDLDLRDAPDVLRAFDAMDRFEHTVGGHGNHHHAGSEVFTLPSRDVLANYMAENEFLKANQVRMVRRAELQRAGAESADRPWGNLDGPYAMFVD